MIEQLKLKFIQLWSSTSDSNLKGIVILKVKRNGDLISSSQDGTIHFWNMDHFILNNTIYIHQNKTLFSY